MLLADCQDYRPHQIESSSMPAVLFVLFQSKKIQLVKNSEYESLHSTKPIALKSIILLYKEDLGGCIMYAIHVLI